MTGAGHDASRPDRVVPRSGRARRSTAAAGPRATSGRPRLGSSDDENTDAVRGLRARLRQDHRDHRGGNRREDDDRVTRIGRMRARLGDEPVLLGPTAAWALGYGSAPDRGLLHVAGVSPRRTATLVAHRTSLEPDDVVRTAVGLCTGPRRTALDLARGVGTATSVSIRGSPSSTDSCTRSGCPPQRLASASPVSRACTGCSSRAACWRWRGTGSGRRRRPNCACCFEISGGPIRWCNARWCPPPGTWSHVSISDGRSSGSGSSTTVRRIGMRGATPQLADLVVLQGSPRPLLPTVRR